VFLRELLRHLRGPVIVLLDNSTTPKRERVIGSGEGQFRQLLAKFGFHFLSSACPWRITKIMRQSAFGISLDNASAIDSH
jgi:hypothetical protein